MTMQAAGPYETFADALLAAEKPVPDRIVSHTAEIPIKRFAVYRNNVVVGLVNALRKRFPVVERVVGDEFFAAMARCFVVEQPPRSPLLMTYGDAFPDFIAHFPPTAELAYLADVARLEAARTRAYHAADGVPFDAAGLAAIPAEQIGALRMSFHPSVEIVRSPHPIVTIWAMNSGEAELGPIEEKCGEDALVARPHLDVEVRALPPGGAVFLAALGEGWRLDAAADAAWSQFPDFDLAQNLAGIFASGFIQDAAHPTLAKAIS